MNFLRVVFLACVLSIKAHSYARRELNCKSHKGGHHLSLTTSSIAFAYLTGFDGHNIFDCDQESTHDRKRLSFLCDNGGTPYLKFSLVRDVIRRGRTFNLSVEYIRPEGRKVQKSIIKLICRLR